MILADMSSMAFFKYRKRVVQFKVTPESLAALAIEYRFSIDIVMIYNHPSNSLGPSIYREKHHPFYIQQPLKC
jgi:hypothetical protein